MPGLELARSDHLELFLLLALFTSFLRKVLCNCQRPFPSIWFVCLDPTLYLAIVSCTTSVYLLTVGSKVANINACCVLRCKPVIGSLVKLIIQLSRTGSRAMLNR